ncbi:hypothetical protein FRC10_000765 [Ceratobasidium sp. 414]|nr:hypothetical protein FRC10_000765 [Ceratobasidium sp. 414]
MVEPCKDDVLLLNMNEIIEAAKPYTFTRAQQRSRKLLLQALDDVPEDVAARVACAASEARQEKTNREQAKQAAKHEQYTQSYAKRRKILDSDETFYYCQPVERDLDCYLELPSAEELKELHRNFLAATSNQALSQGVCASCGRRLMNCDLSREDFLSLPNARLLCPKSLHESHTLTRGMLLESQFVEEVGDSVLGWICRHCLSALKQNRLPAYSLANNMWLGPIPDAIRDLNIPEQLLISLRYPRGYVYKLYPRGGKNADHPGALQSGLRGNVTTYMANVKAVTEMLTGELMPRKMSILPSLIAIAFVGRTKVSKAHIKSLFRVRRKAVYAALMTLKEVTQHPGYVNLEISKAVLDTLPEDDIPDEIWQTLRVEPDESVIEKESAGYVPFDPSLHNIDELIADSDSEDNSEDEGDKQNNNKHGCEIKDYANTVDELGGNIPGENTNNLEGDSTEEGIIPLEYSGTSAADASYITPQELMQSAIENLTSQLQSHMLNEGGYAVRHGGFARDFGKRRQGQEATADDDENPSCFTFPCLFPFGLGGLEIEREVQVSFADHTRWCLQYHDGRFRKHHMFPVWAFANQQKRQALTGSKLVMHRRDYDRVSAAISGLTADDLQRAAVEEENKQPFSDPRVALLRRFAQTTMQNVMGSDASRALNRSKLWSTSLYLNPMSLWITINPTDRHDPICQVFAGENIDMDHFDSLAGPSALQRACNVASDPFAASQFFFFLAETILETLFGFSIRNRTVPNRMGALGLGSAYFGAVEAQGRGSLHLHLMMWLCNSPNAQEVIEKLKCPDFREKIKKFIQTNLHSHVDSLDQATLDVMESDPGLAWGRPPDPDSPTYGNDLALLEIRLARAQQYHRCSTSTCLRYDRQLKKMVCKRHAPFELSPEDQVTEGGEIKTKRTMAYLNTWNPAVFYGGRCNNDIKFITNGSQASSLGFYITLYATKKQGRSYNQSALMAKTYMFHNAKLNEEHLDSQKANSSFLFHCALGMNREQEYSSQQIMGYLMGRGDTVQSHSYTPIYWSAVVRELKLAFPELKSSSDLEGQKGAIREHIASPAINDKAASTDQDNNSVDNATSTSSNTVYTEPETLGVTKDGTLYLRSQIIDYQYRGKQLEHYNFLDYFVDTYEEPISQRSMGKSANSVGRPHNPRILYLEAHPRYETFGRVRRSTRHRSLPNVIGKWFERNDNPDTYDFHCASVLACLKPWRRVDELKGGYSTWPDALKAFDETANDHQKCIKANMQYYYQSQGATEPTVDEATANGNGNQGQRLDNDDVELSELINNIALPEVLLSPKKREQLAHAERAVAIGRRLGLFGRQEAAAEPANSSSISMSSEMRYTQISQWTDALHKINSSATTALDGSIQPSDTGDTLQLNQAPFETALEATIDYSGDVIMENTNDPDVSMLSPEQLRAYNLFKSHLDQSTSGQNPPQLLMNIQGEGGTGKSLVIAKITELVEARRQQNILKKGAYTGIAASHIGGATLHKLAFLHIRSPNITQKIITQLRETWKDVKYFIIDEISMVSKQILGKLHEMLCIATQEPGVNNNSLPFGGINIIFAGDFHQFPPVMGQGPGRGALYAPGSSKSNTTADTGEQLYSQFNTVVILRQQFRNEDPLWRSILTRLRRGECTRADIAAIRSLILTEKDRELLSSAPWTDAVLVTPRCVVRNQWNEEASRSQCRRTGDRLVISHATDYYKGQPVTQTFAALIASRAMPGTSGNDPGGLPDVIHLARGMPVMVTANVETEVDVANGSRGIIEEIIVHSDEQNAFDSSAELQLKRPPACVLVRLSRTRAAPIPGLEDGVIPIVPIRNNFKLTIRDKVTATISREQIPLIPAYAFTDYRAQGQTLPYVIIDLAKPPNGGLTPFNAYVALSRSRSMKQCRLLRDFDESLFIMPPSPMLLEEDRRLEEKDAKTRRNLEAEELPSGSSA